MCGLAYLFISRSSYIKTCLINYGIKKRSLAIFFRVQFEGLNIFPTYLLAETVLLVAPVAANRPVAQRSLPAGQALAGAGLVLGNDTG